jgi:hypothetical protein
LWLSTRNLLFQSTHRPSLEIWLATKWMIFCLTKRL